MNTDTVTTAPVPAPSFEEAMAFVREHAGEVRLSSGELLADHAAGTAAIMRTLNVVRRSRRCAKCCSRSPRTFVSC